MHTFWSMQRFMCQQNQIQAYYFLGIGGIGMSALARYFFARGYKCAGYDRTPSPVTKALESEGITVTYDDNENALPEWATRPKSCLIVRTPAVPLDSRLTQWFEQQGFTILKRAEVLGDVTRQMRALCVAGTHGKTTTSTMLAHLLRQSSIGGNAFLGGISNNFQSNLLIDKSSSYVVVEADEYDRSFHHLTPYMSVVTAVDPDHLDIYGTPEAYREAFEHYTSLIQSALVMKKGLPITPRLGKGVKCYTYEVYGSPTPALPKREGEVPRREGEMPSADFYADNIRVSEGKIMFDFHTPNTTIPDLNLGAPVWVNIENSVAAMAMAWLNGVTAEELRLGIASFAGVWRRFNILINRPNLAYVDDYAHHPQEIASSVQSVKMLFPKRHTIGVFQPHLYTRTRDFADGFAQSLSALDELVLLPIYPAREEPIEGVSSEMLMDKVTCPVTLVEKADLVAYLKEHINPEQPTALITIGAGDIDRLVPLLVESLELKV